MIIKKTYIPGKPRNPKLVNSGGSNTTVQGGGGGSSTEGHTHNNKSVLDKITEATLEGANREIITTESESLPTDENLYSALKTKEEIDEIAGALNDKLSKIDDDEAQGIITFLKGLISKGKSIFEDDAEFWRLILAKAGINIGQFSSGLFGSGATLRMNNGVSELEVDKLLVRMRAEFFSVLIHNAKHIGGELVMSPAEMMCIKVEETPNFYRCYFDTDGGKVINLFTNKDFARCQIFTGATQKFYWRKVVAAGVDYIELSKTDMVAGSDVPEIGDNIFQLGSLDPERQSAMIFSTAGYDAPSFKQYKDIDSMSLEGKDHTVFSGKGNKIVGKTVFMSDGKNVEDKINSIKVGGKNLLREQDIRFDFKYWGEDGESINVDFDNLKSILTTENNLMLITENNFLIEM